MRIQHNIPALSAYRNYSNNTSALAKNLEKLSSGYRINRAGDDAAGLAISEKMRAQISGLEQAQSNAKSGINLVQTAEGALTEVHDMLNRMYTLAEQSANGTFDDDVDRVQLQKEVDQLRDEINRIAESANFNGIKLLDGSMDANATVTTGGDLVTEMNKYLNTLPGSGNHDNRLDVGEAMLLHQEGQKEGKTSFGINFHNSCIEGASTGASAKIEIGTDENKFTLEVVLDTDATKDGWDEGTGVYVTKSAENFKSGDKLASIFKAAFEAAKGEDEANGKISKQDFTAEATGSTLTFTQTKDPTRPEEVVLADQKVSVTLDAGDGTTPAVVGNVVRTDSVVMGTATTKATFKTTVPLTKDGVFQVGGKFFKTTGTMPTTPAARAITPTGGNGDTAETAIELNLTEKDTRKDVADAIVKALTDAGVNYVEFDGVTTDGSEKVKFDVTADGDGNLVFTAQDNCVLKDATNKDLTEAGLITAVNKGVTSTPGTGSTDKPGDNTPSGASSITAPSASVNVGGTPAAYTEDSSNQVNGITITVDAAKAGAGDVKVKVEDVSAAKATGSGSSSDLSKVTITYNEDGTAGNFNIKFVKSDNGTTSGTWTAGADGNPGTLTVTLKAGTFTATQLQSEITGLASSLSGVTGAPDVTKIQVTDKDASSDALSLTVSGTGDIETVTLADGVDAGKKVTLTSGAGTDVKTYKTTEWTGTVNMAGENSGVTAAITAATVSSAVPEKTVGTVSAAAGGIALTTSTLDKDAIKTAADKTSGIADGLVKLQLNTTSNKLELAIGDKVIGTSTEAVDGTATTFNFKATDGTTSLGKITAASAPAVADFADAVDTGMTYTAASSGAAAGKARGMGRAGSADGITTEAITQTAKTGVVVNWKNATGGSSTSDKDNISNADAVTFDTDAAKLVDYINKNNLPVGSGTGEHEVTVKTIASGESSALQTKFGLYVGDTLVGVAVDDSGDAVAVADTTGTSGSPAEVTYNFKAVDASAGSIVADSDLGSLTLKDTGTGQISANDFATAKKVGAAVTPGVDGSSYSQKTVDFAVTNDQKTNLLDAAKAKTEIDAGHNSISVKVESGTAKLYAGLVEIGTGTLDSGTVTFKDAGGKELMTMALQDGQNDLTAFTDGAAIATGLVYDKPASGTGEGGGDEGGDTPAVTPGTGTADKAGQTFNSATTTISVGTSQTWGKDDTLDAGTVTALNTAFSGANKEVAVNSDIKVNMEHVMDGLDNTKSVGDLVDKIKAAAQTAIDTWNNANTDKSFKYELDSIMLDGTNNLLRTAGQADLKIGVKTVARDGGNEGGDTEGSGSATGIAGGTYNVSTTQNVQGKAPTTGLLASTTLELNAEYVKDGNVLTIGNTEYVFKIGSKSTVDEEAAEKAGQIVINLSKYETVSKDALIEAGTQISNPENSVQNKAFEVGFNRDDLKLSIHERLNQQEFVNGELAYKDTFAALIHVNTATSVESAGGKALTLQIGDTSDDYNQLNVNILNCHTNAMGTYELDENKNMVVEAGKTIADIDISQQDTASDAIDIIKNAINYVSDVRGTLGATQNRLDHTINNLSVMAENIQDAESTIRDVDVAKEMMEYTKNNILVQSAQAMLAQANQLPQGVLQLLQ